MMNRKNIFSCFISKYIMYIRNKKKIPHKTDKLIAQ